MSSRIRRTTIAALSWKRSASFLTAALASALAFSTEASPGAGLRLRPPLWQDRDDRDIPQPKERDDRRDLFEIVNNSWTRHLSPELKARKALDPGALNVNAWDEVPDSSWFTNRIGRRRMTFEEIERGMEGVPPSKGRWRIDRLKDEGYTPGFDITDGENRQYVLKLDIPGAVERNSAAERISTLIMHAAGYNVPHNSIVTFSRADLVQDEKSYVRDAIGRRRVLTSDDVDRALEKLEPLPDGRYRGLASHRISGTPLGPFIYTGRREDDANDIIPHELRRELRGLRVIASWINHVDVKDQNALDVYDKYAEGRSYVRHYLIDFGSSLGSGNFVNGPFRVGHEYIYDAHAMGLSFLTFGIWQRPWQARGRILYPEVGYYSADLFEPRAWKPNYPNLAFERMDDSDAYWGAKIVTSFTDELIRRLVGSGEYSRGEVTAHVQEVLRRRRDAIGAYWFERVTPLEDFVLEASGNGHRIRFRDLAVERKVVDAASRLYRFRLEGAGGARVRRIESTVLSEGIIELADLKEAPVRSAARDRFGRVPALRLTIESARSDQRWALPVTVVLGYSPSSSQLEVLGWTHAPR